MLFRSFDTGASQSFVAKDFAEKHNIKIVSDSILLGGLGGQDYASLGVVDTIKIANIVYTNMPVYIGNTEYPKDSITIEAVLGVQFMKDIGAIKIEPNINEISFIRNDDDNQSNKFNRSDKVSELVKSNKYNVSLFGNRMLVELFSKNQRMLMFCDTGAANAGYINDNVHKNNPDFLDKIESESKYINSRGFAGSVQIKTQDIPSIELTIGDKKRTFSDFKLVDQTLCDGAIGVEFFKQCEMIILDLNELYLYIE